jgi:hypothetical protein
MCDLVEEKIEVKDLAAESNDQVESVEKKVDDPLEKGNSVLKFISKLIVKKSVSKSNKLPPREERLLHDFFHPVRPVESKGVERGTSFILELVNINPGIQLFQLVEKSNFVKKRVKRILNNNIFKAVTKSGVTRYYIKDLA